MCGWWELALSGPGSGWRESGFGAEHSSGPINRLFTLSRALKTRRLILVLDNCEHLSGSLRTIGRIAPGLLLEGANH